MNENYVLTWPWRENQEMKEWLETQVSIANSMLENIENIGMYEDLFFQAGNVEYIVTKIRAGVVENHKDSDAIVTLECMQIPSADYDYTFEVSEEYFAEYNKKLTTIYNSIHSYSA